MANLFLQAHMTGSFMRCYKKLSVFLTLICLSIAAVAADSSVVIKSADLKAVDAVYHLNADLEIQLDDEIKEAINKGVGVEFIYEFTLVSPRTFWFDKELVSTSTSINVSYHALSRQYLVIQDERQTSHEILSEAMIEFVQLYDWAVFDRTVIEAGETYVATLNVSLDQSKLPKAIQVEAISSEDWDLAAETFEWVPASLKQK